MADFVFDIECDGLDPSVVHCFSGSGGVHSQGTVGLQRYLDSADTVVAHNGVRYDFPVLERLEGITVDRSRVVDTLVLSRLERPDRLGGHSLEAWGERLGYPKVAHEDWSSYSPDMRNRCDTDVKITEKLWETLKGLLKDVPQDAIDLEHRCAWIIKEQEDNGFLLDTRYAMELANDLRDRQWALEKEVRERFVPLCSFVKEVTPKINRDGSMSKVGLQCLEGQDCGGPFSRVTWVEFNLGSRQQIAKHLQRFGWKPLKFTEKGNVIVDEGVLEDVKIPEAQLILQYITAGKLASMVESWLAAQGEDDRVHGQVNSCGAVTTRMTHMNPNLGQVPRRSEDGQRCRQCFTVPPGYDLCGVDAEGLELRLLAHFMDDPSYIEAVVNGNSEAGTDAHSMNMRAAGLKDRDTAKTFIYAFMYGAGGAKIAAIADLGSARAGADLKRKFLRKMPKLNALIERVKGAASRGYLRGLDGRKLWVRNDYAALNTLLQGAGAVVMKRALVILYDDAKAAGLDFKLVCNVHDEIQAEVHKDHVQQYAEIAEAAIVKAGEYYNLRCPMAGSAQIGSTWRETH